jgi:pimeloyl-ACP methyl ester carboxylesterase
LWRHVIEDLRPDFRCIAPNLPLGGHRQPMRADADLSMRGIANILGELLERLELQDITLAMSDWGGPQLLIGSAYEQRIARLAICSCEAFDNVPPRGAARLMPYIARVPGGLTAALLPFRVDRLRRLPMTYGPLSKRAVPREVMDRWFGPVTRQPAIRRDLGKYVRSAAQGRRDLLAAAEALRSFDRPALVAWASEDRLMPREHGRQLAELLPQGRLVEIEDSYTLIPEDQPALLAAQLRELQTR